MSELPSISLEDRQKEATISKLVEFEGDWNKALVSDSKNYFEVLKNINTQDASKFVGITSALVGARVALRKSGMTLMKSPNPRAKLTGMVLTGLSTIPLTAEQKQQGAVLSPEAITSVGGLTLGTILTPVEVSFGAGGSLTMPHPLLVISMATLGLILKIYKNMQNKDLEFRLRDAIAGIMGYLAVGTVGFVRGAK